MSEAALNRALARVVDAAHAMVAALNGRGKPEERLEQLRTACRDGAEFLARTWSLMQSLSPRVLRDEAQEQVLAEVDRAFAETGRGISAILHSGEAANLAVLQSAIKAFEEGLAHVYQCLHTLQDLERKEPGLSPLPLLDDLLRAAMTVWDGKADVTALAPWFPAAADMLRRLSGQCRVFAIAHPEEPTLAKDAADLVQTLEDGVGALVLFAETHDRAALADGMSLLAQNSMALNAAVLRMDATARQRTDFSSFPALQEAWLVVEHLSRHDDPTLTPAVVAGIESLQRFQNDQVRALEALPLAWTIPEAIAAARQSIHQLDKAVEMLRQSITTPALAIAPLMEVRDRVEAVRQAIQAAQQALQAELRKTEGFPNIEHLKEVTGRLLAGSISNKGFLVRFAYLASTLERLCEQARESGLSDVLTLLERQRTGFETITRYFRTFDQTHLRDGMAILDETLPQLRALQADVSAQRHQMVHESSYDTEVPELLLRVDRMVRELEAGTLKPEAFTQQIRQESDRLAALAAEFRTRIGVMLKRSADPAILEAARDFGDAMQDVLAGLQSMQACTNPDLLYGGFERARRGILNLERATAGSRAE